MAGGRKKKEREREFENSMEVAKRRRRILLEFIERTIELRERANGSGCVFKVKLIDAIG